MKWLYLFMLLMVIISSCQRDEVEPMHTAPKLMEIPKGFDSIEFPDDNAYTQARWELGKKLFFDPVMSIDSSISCASCHNPELAFSDKLALSLGVENRLGTSNASTLANVAYHPYMLREGGVPSLEMQILVPIQEHNEFDFNIVLLAERLTKIPEYVNMTQTAYERAPDPFTITRALANFERSLISGYSRYDHYENYGDENALNASELRGMDLFFSAKTNCSSCHSGFNFTNYAFENNGLYEQYESVGRFRVTGKESDRATFKIPSLRNIAITSPYMHDGSINNLEDVIAHYNSGAKNHPQKSELIRPLNLTVGEQNDLLQFLNALTDESFINNPNFIN